ncbi:MAG TPA: homoserine kinase [Candidatus Acidoferrales bacterium]|jgi:homoserine kinase|nr:homoserine kinase [Candidatus Acidoferrales bacterium]
MSAPRENAFEVRVPASTANLGAGFDCLGLALELYLGVRATVISKPGSSSRARSWGVVGTAALPRSPDQNLILRAMKLVAEREGFKLPTIRLAVQNEIPVAGGLGSSAAAAVAGVALGYLVNDKPIPKETVLRYAAELEGHADNVGAALMGGFVVTFTRSDGTVVAVRKRWPKMIRLIVVTPATMLETKKSRGVLPQTVSRADAVHNLQRTALFVAAIEERRFELLSDAMQDKLHQDARKALIPGLSDVLAIPKMPGLLGVALSGAGPSVIALATDRFEEIGKTIASKFEKHGVASTVRILEAAQEGLTSTQKWVSAR